MDQDIWLACPQFCGSHMGPKVKPGWAAAAVNNFKREHRTGKEPFFQWGRKYKTRQAAFRASRKLAGKLNRGA